MEIRIACSKSPLAVLQANKFINAIKKKYGNFILFSSDFGYNSKKIIKLIREKIGFKTIIITDDISMKALKHPIQISTIKAFDAGCDIVLHCNGNINEMTKVAKNSPKLSNFLIKKTSQLNKFLS